MMRRSHLLFGLALIPLLLSGAYMVTIYSELPGRVAIHWDFHGKPNGWMTREGYFTYLICFVTVMDVLMIGARWIPPRLMRFPHKWVWISRPDLKGELQARLRVGLTGAMVLINWSALAAFHLTVSQAIPTKVPLFSASVGQFIVGVLLATAVFLIWFYDFMKPPGDSRVPEAV